MDLYVSTCRRHVLDPWAGRVPRAKGLCARTTDPLLWSQGTTPTEAQVPQSLCSATGEATAMGSPHTTAGERTWLASTREQPARL